MRNKVLTREKIIEVGEKIIKNESLEACSTRRLAKELNCALGTIYNYFSSRDAFLRQIFIHSWNKTFLKIEQLIGSDKTPDIKISEMFDVVNQDITHRNGIGDYILKTTCDKSKEEEDEISKYVKKVIKILLKESSSIKECSEEVIDINTEWIYYGSIILRKKGKDMELFKQAVIKKFFTNNTK